MPQLWEEKLGSTAFHTKTALETGDFSFLNQFKVNSIYFTSTGTESNDADLSKAQADLKEIGGNAAMSAETDVYQPYHESLEKLQTKTTTREDWEKRLEDGATEAKKESAALIDRYAAKAHDIIIKVPEDRRDAAANIWIGVWANVSGVIQTICKKVGDLLLKIADFMIGLWNGIKAAWESVKSTVSHALNVLGLGNFATSTTHSPSKGSSHDQNFGGVPLEQIIQAVQQAIAKAVEEASHKHNSIEAF